MLETILSTALTKEAIGTLIAGVLGAGLAYKKIRAMFAAENVQIARNDSQADVIEILNQQAKSFAANNKELQTEVETLRKSNSDLTIETMQLKHSLSQLQKENAELLSKIESLRSEIDKLTSLIEQLGQKV